MYVPFDKWRKTHVAMLERKGRPERDYLADLMWCCHLTPDQAKREWEVILKMEYETQQREHMRRREALFKAKAKIVIKPIACDTIQPGSTTRSHTT